ncbi:DUF1642 domain-containing protein [Bacillus sp. FJAT-26390]|uniref:DUF1642 domain-containing protein n=1 Tax=Bacillus sp. FJAT-26390 TaxID=1743142 RepID=UPI000807B0C3|nr:DUF1642 domain-containing protein [Bacillus sp. FJAT-26390]OBZ13314.1 hypothetical protein A7975_10675 [Bacillus sp. FJAT-26390]
MGRMKDRDFHLVKRRVMEDGCYESGSVLVKGLIGHVEAIESELHEVVAKFGQSEKNVDRLTENVAQLQKENMSMLELIKKHEAPAKVVLPQYVADDIKARLKANRGMFYSAIHDFVHNAGISPRTWHWVNSHVDCNLIATAMINGYTVEKSKEERLREGVYGLVMKWWSDPAEPQLHEDLANKVTDFVTKFHAENA